MPQTWSEAFKAHIHSRFDAHAQKEAAFALRLTPSTIHYWCRGARPRDAKVRARIARWSRGKVAADLPATNEGLRVAS